MRVWFAIGWLSLCLVLSPSAALASGFAAPSVGPTSSGVTTVDPAASAQNPAAIGFLTERRIVLGGNLLIADLRYQRERLATYQYEDSLDFALPIDPALIDPTKRGVAPEVSDNPIGAVGDVFGAVPIGDLPLVVGVGVYVPYAAMLSLPKNGPQRFQITDAFIAAGQFTPSIAYRPHKLVSLGAGVSYVFGYANISKVQDLATLRDLGEALARPPIGQSNSFGPDADPGVRELSTFARPFSFKNGTAHGATFSIGVTAQPLPDLWIGASYEHSTKMTFRGDFELNMNDPFFTQDLVSQGLSYPPIVRGDATLSFVLPRTARLGIRYDFGDKVGEERRLSAALEGSYTGWSSVSYFDVRLKSRALEQPMLGLPSSTGLKLPRHFKDTFGGRVRGRLVVSPELSLWAQLGVETGAVPDRTIDMASPDGTRIAVAIGAAQNLTDDLRVILDAQLHTMLERHVVRSDYDLGNGTYGLRIAVIGAHLDYLF